MVTLKRLNVVRKVATEEQAAKLERMGFTRTGGTAETPVGASVSEADLAKMGEAMFESLSKRLDDRLKAATKGKGSKDGKKEGQNGGTDQPGGGDGAE